MENLPSPSETKLVVNKKTLIYGGVGLASIFLAVLLGFFIIQFQKASTVAGVDPKLAAAITVEKERDKLISKISELVEVPGNEIPTIATVSDKNKIKSQLFYKNCENGDKVLIYKNSKTVVLYRPSTNKIINIATGIPVEVATPTPVPIKINASPAVIFRAVTPTDGESTPSATQLNR